MARAHGRLKPVQNQTQVLGEIGSGRVGDLTGKAMDRLSNRPGYARESVGIAAEADRGTHRVFPGFRLKNGRDCRRYCARSRNIETTPRQLCASSSAKAFRGASLEEVFLLV
jgi:hypothetical protein